MPFSLLHHPTPGISPTAIRFFLLCMKVQSSVSEKPRADGHWSAFQMVSAAGWKIRIWVGSELQDADPVSEPEPVLISFRYIPVSWDAYLKQSPVYSRMCV